MRTSRSQPPALMGVGPGYASFRELLYYERKRCMLVSTKLVAEFSRACAPLAARPLISATHPPHAIREVTLVDTPQAGRTGQVVRLQPPQPLL
jgi:hypothetical protein